MFITGQGRVTERLNAIEASEEVGRKGQELREISRDLDLLRTDVALLSMVLRLRGAPPPADVHADSEENAGAEADSTGRTNQA